MEISDIKVLPVQEEKLKAYVTITLDGCFVVRDIKIIEGPSGLFLSMPSKKRHDGTYKDVAHPINKETRAMMERRVLEAYDRTLASERRTPAQRSSLHAD